MYCVLTFTLQFSSVLVEIRGLLGASRGVCAGLSVCSSHRQIHFFPPGKYDNTICASLFETDVQLPEQDRNIHMQSGLSPKHLYL